ncbi:hypothetical protein MJ585_06530 [Klebsiella pneumoniae]|nr:hypothetical protein MJ585_06530 [Klebsiella pneumoniae]
MKEKGEAAKQPVTMEEIHTAKNRRRRHRDCRLATVFGFAMIWHIWWMQDASFIGIVATDY